MSLNSTRQRFAKIAVIAVSGGLVATLAIPAYALDPSGAGTTSVASIASGHPTQSLVSLTAAEIVPVVRDGYTAKKAQPSPQSRPAVTANRFVAINPPAQSYSGEAVVAFARQFVGVVPYGSGNSPTTSFSCDGLTQFVFAAFGISLPRGSDSQARLGVRISPGDARAGDLLWWPGQHIGIYDGAGRMIDSPKPGHYVEHRGIWGNPVYIRLA